MPYKIALTGHHGFLGRHFIYHVSQKNQEGKTKKGVHLKDGSQKDNSIECVCLNSNLLDAHALYEEIQAKDFDYLIHLAAHTQTTHDLDYYQTNVIGSENLFKALQDKHKTTPIKRIILCSTSHLYKPINRPIKENDELDPISHYALSKYAMEQRSLSYDLPFCIVRLFNTIGTGQKENFLLPKIIHAYKHKHTHVTLGNINIQRDFSCVRWVINQLLELILQDSLPHIINICSNKSHSIADILHMMAQISGHNCSIMQDPHLMRQEPSFIQGDNSLILSITKTSPPDIKQTLEWIFKHS